MVILIALVSQIVIFFISFSAPPGQKIDLYCEANMLFAGFIITISALKYLVS